MGINQDGAWSKAYNLEGACIFGHHVNHIGIEWNGGTIHIVEYEGKGMSLNTAYFPNDDEKARRAFKRACTDLLNGKNL